MTPALLGAVMEAWDAVVEPALRAEGVVYYERREIREQLRAAVRERLGKVEDGAAPCRVGDVVVVGGRRHTITSVARDAGPVEAGSDETGWIVTSDEGGAWALHRDDVIHRASPVAAPSSDPAEFTSAEDVLVWLSGFGGGENQPTVAAVREAIAFARANIADRLQTARADVYESVSRERDEASAALLTEQDRTAALRSALTRLIDAAAPHVGAEYATEEETRALRNALKNAREDMR